MECCGVLPTTQFDGVGLAQFQPPVLDGVDLWVSRAGPMLLRWPKLLCPYYSLLLFSLSLSIYRMVLWGWGLQNDMVYITLSQPCTSE